MTTLDRDGALDAIGRANKAIKESIEKNNGTFVVKMEVSWFLRESFNYSNSNIFEQIHFHREIFLKGFLHIFFYSLKSFIMVSRKKKSSRSMCNNLPLSLKLKIKTSFWTPAPN